MDNPKTRSWRVRTKALGEARDRLENILPKIKERGEKLKILSESPINNDLIKKLAENASELAKEIEYALGKVLIILDEN